jgi:cytochrome P450/nitrite reductase/ring-hydroxylating ferredoxin subunit
LQIRNILNEPECVEMENSKMANYIRVAEVTDLLDDQPAAVHVEGVDLVLLKHDDTITLVEGRCPHQGTLLAEGTLEDGVLICRGHGWRFACASGLKVDDPTIALHRFAVSVADGQVLADRDQIRAWKRQRVHEARSMPGPAARPARRSLAHLPGPKGLPLIGNALQLDPKRLHLILEQWRRRFGSIYTFKLMHRPFVVIAAPDLIQHMLRDRPETYRRISAIESVPKEMGINGVFSAEGEQWRRQRRLAMQALDTRHLRQFFPTLINVTRRLQQRWAAAAKAQRAVDVQKDLMRYTVDVTTNLAFGYDMNTLEQGEDVIQRHLERIFPMVNRRINAPFPYWRYYKRRADRDLDQALAAIRQIIGEIITHSRRRLAQASDRAEHPANFLEAMLIAQEEGQTQLTDDEVFGNIFTMLLAGEDTTANTMAWMLHFLSHYPDVQTKLQAEVDAVLGQADLLPDIKAADKLTYLEAVAYETMRLKPVVPFLFLEANEDVEVGGVSIPKATAIVALTWDSGLQEDHFPVAHDFQPERWLAHSASAARDRHAIMPFGSGPRLCPGRSLALLEIKAALSMVCRHFSFTPAADAGPVGEVFAFTLMPTNVLLDFSERNHRDIL